MSIRPDGNKPICRLGGIDDVVLDTGPVNLAEMDKQRRNERREELQKHRKIISFLW